MYHNASARSWTYTGPQPPSAVPAFHAQLPGSNTTPLVPLASLARDLQIGCVLVKDESSRLGLPAFKILGASWAVYNAVASKCSARRSEYASQDDSQSISLEELGKRAREKGIKLVTCTDGNWGRATARMARFLQIPATIHVPKYMDAATREKIKSEGAEVIEVDGDYDTSIRISYEAAGKDECALFVSDVSFEGFEEIPRWVVEGYSTMLAEADRQLEEQVGKPVTHVVVSVGVGSWAQAVVSHYKARSETSPVTVITVEPEAAACLQTSLQAGRIVPITTGQTIMDGLNCGTVSYSAWDVLREGVDVSVSVSDKDVHRDVEYLHSQGVKNGPCGAATLTGLRKVVDAEEIGLCPDSVVVLFSTEGARDYIVPR